MPDHDDAGDYAGLQAFARRGLAAQKAVDALSKVPPPCRYYGYALVGPTELIPATLFPDRWQPVRPDPNFACAVQAGNGADATQRGHCPLAIARRASGEKL